MRYIIILLVLLASCAVQQAVPQQQLCTSPYIEWSAGQCCLDADGNGICDSDENQPVIVPYEPPAVKKSTLITDMLASLPKNYAFQNADTGLVIVVGDKRRTIMEAITTGATSIFWDLDEKKAWSVCDSKEEVLQLGKLYSDETARCPVNVVSVKELSPSEYQMVVNNVKGPIDWMEEYKDRAPSQVDTSLHQIGVRSVSPIIVFQEPDGTMISMMFDYYYKVPTRIEIVKVVSGIPKKQVIDYEFYKNGKDRFFPELSTVTVPADSIERKGYLLEVSEAYAVDYETIRVRGYFKNTGLSTTQLMDIHIKCYDAASEVIGSADVSIPPVERYNTKTFQTTVHAESGSLDYCLASL